MPFIPPFGSPPGGAAGATTALDNLASVQINTDLIFADDAGATEYIIGVDAQTASNTDGNALTFESGAGLGSGVGGDLSFFASTGGSTGAGGNILLSTGKGQGGGSDGQFQLLDPGGRTVILDTSSIATTDKTFTFPNITGTFALTSDIPAAGATTELDNLGTTAINTSLISDTDSTDDLGSSSKLWANLYVDAITFADSTPHVILQNISAGTIEFVSSGNSSYSFRLSLPSDGDQNTVFNSGVGDVRFVDNLTGNFDSVRNLGSTTIFWGETFTDELILTNVGAAAAAADKLVLSAVDLSAGNTILDINTEGTGVTGTGTPAADRTIAIRVNGEIIYLIGSTAAS